MDNMNYKVDWEENCINLYQQDQDSRPLRTTDPEFEEIHSIPDKEKNENLKFFSFNSISGKIFELAIHLGPNLEEIQVRKDKAEDHKHFIEPLNRLGFCKDLQFSTDSSDVFKKIADLAHEGNLKLRNIFFMFECQNNPDNYFLGPFTDDEVDAFNKILASCWESLETLHWRRMMSVPGLKWPNVMPNVWKIILGPLHYTLEDGLLAFPQDFSWSKTFPKLRHLDICQAVEIQGFQQLLRCFKSQCMDSVKEVHVFDRQSKQRDYASASQNLEQLRRLFPSARVLSTWPFNNRR